MHYFLIFIPLFLSSFLNAHICKIEKFSKGNLTIYSFSDFHFAKKIENQINPEQRSDILALAKKFNALVLVEDGASIHTPSLLQNPRKARPNHGIYLKEQLEKMSPKVTLLLGFNSWCRHEGIMSINIENRLAYNASATGQNISVEDVLCSSDNRAKLIESFDDNDEHVQKYYKKYKGIYEKTRKDNKEFFDFFLEDTRKNKNIKDLSATLTDEEAAQLENILKTYQASFTSSLHIEAIISSISQQHAHCSNNKLTKEQIASVAVHKLAQSDLHLEDALTLRWIAHFDKNNGFEVGEPINKKFSTIFLMAGGEHIKNLKNALKDLGYTHTALCKATLSYDENGNPLEPKAVHIKDYFPEIAV